MNSDMNNDINKNLPTTTTSFNGHTIHPDIQDLLWVMDGSCKNYNVSKNDTIRITYGNYILTFNLCNNCEPSAISTKLPISASVNFDTPRPSYYPTYSGLSQEQRAIYWELLENPYNTNIDIGYVFILYYGLERHLFSGNYKKAYDVILKLRNVHQNKSFQMYSSNALVLSAHVNQDRDAAIKFIDSIDTAHEMQIDANIYTLCKLGLNIPLYPHEIILLRKQFYFTNDRYIKNQSEQFYSELRLLITEKYGTPTINIRQFFDDDSFLSIQTKYVRIFANMSMLDKEIPIPLLIDHPKYWTTINRLLKEAHERVKANSSKSRNRIL